MFLDVAAVFFLGHMHSGRGRDSAWFALPMFLGCVTPNLIAIAEDLRVRTCRPHGAPCHQHVGYVTCARVGIKYRFQ
eukprot:456328-Pyramimonas_sp.AAC.1